MCSWVCATVTKQLSEPAASATDEMIACGDRAGAAAWACVDRLRRLEEAGRRYAIGCGEGNPPKLSQRSPARIEPGRTTTLGPQLFGVEVKNSVADPECADAADDQDASVDARFGDLRSFSSR
jgi:hypothetical protein